MTEVVSLANFCPNCGESLSSHGTTKGETRKTARRAYEPAKKKRKASASNKKYGRAFKQVAPRFKKKNGQWKKNGFKNAVRAAHKKAKGMR